MKNKKSLGQVAFEKSYYKNNPWMDQVSESKYYWNRIAKAVEREVNKRSNNGWIHVSERRPNKTDCLKGYNYVLACDSDGTVVMVDINSKHFDYLEYWQPCPKAPKKIGKKGRR